MSIDTIVADYPAPLRVRTELALRAYDRVADDHAKNFDWPRSAPHLCKCGREFGTGQGLGLHIAAVSRQADRAMAGEQDRVRMLLGIPGSWVRVEREGFDPALLTIQSVGWNDIEFEESKHSLVELLELGFRVTEAGGRA